MMFYSSSYTMEQRIITLRREAQEERSLFFPDCRFKYCDGETCRGKQPLAHESCATPKFKRSRLKIFNYKYNTSEGFSSLLSYNKLGFFFWKQLGRRLSVLLLI